MAVLTKKLNIQKTGATTVACNIYSTTTEAGSTYINATVDGVSGYVSLGSTSHAKATVGRATKSGTTYAILSANSVPYTKKTYTTAGTHTFTVPTGITKVKLTVAGGGGGGAGCDSYTYQYSYYIGKWGNTYYDYATGYRAGGAGGQGGLYTGTVSVTTGSTYSITVGAGGSGGSGNDSTGGSGGTSKFGSLASATGGTGGSQNTAGTAGTPSGAGGAGGAGGAATSGSNGSAGGTGWVYVEYGEGIE